MIIDTESPEGKALVALAKFGKVFVDAAKCEHRWSINWIDISQMALGSGLMDDYLNLTDLAKLPEGI